MFDDTMKLASVILILGLLSSSVTMSEELHDNAGVYSTQSVKIDRDLIVSLAGKAEVSETVEGEIKKLVCRWTNVSVAVVVDPKWDGDVQIKGMRGWISRFPEEERDITPVAALLRTMDSVTNCYGCVITPGYDPDGKAKALILGLAKKAQGFVFSHQTFYDTEGKKIIGLPGDPVTLGPKK
jgi:hypothetical protein